jgi:hypothetical protein
MQHDEHQVWLDDEDPDEERARRLATIMLAQALDRRRKGKRTRVRRYQRRPPPLPLGW